MLFCFLFSKNKKRSPRLRDQMIHADKQEMMVFKTLLKEQLTTKSTTSNSCDLAFSLKVRKIDCQRLLKGQCVGFSGI